MLKDDDCYFPINGNTLTIEQYCKDNFNSFNFSCPHSDFHVWSCHHFEYDTVRDIVLNDPTLSKIDKVLEISHCFIMEISKNSWVGWHFDYPRKGPALNLLLTPSHRSFSLFTETLYDMSNIIECQYKPHQYVLYNTDHIHSIINLDEPRYLFSALFKRGKTNLVWPEAIQLLSNIDYE